MKNNYYSSLSPTLAIVSVNKRSEKYNLPIHNTSWKIRHSNY